MILPDGIVIIASSAVLCKLAWDIWPHDGRTAVTVKRLKEAIGAHKRHCNEHVELKFAQVETLIGKIQKQLAELIDTVNHMNAVLLENARNHSARLGAVERELIDLQKDRK